MKHRNLNLNKAPEVQDDEFYTRYEDIEDEIEHYVSFNTDVFRGKTILLPCDNYRHSNFFKYFNKNFLRLGIGRVIATYLSSLECRVGRHYNLFEPYENKKSKMAVIESGVTRVYNLSDSGDYRSEEICKLRDESDMIITNPPFSILQDFWMWIGDKGRLILGPMTALMYRHMFEGMRSGGVWIGVNRKPMHFLREGKVEPGVVNVLWYTDLHHGFTPDPIKLKSMTENKEANPDNPNLYVEIDNYDAIDVPLVSLIPSDCDGMMAVPISFMAKFNPDQFEILGSTRGRGQDPAGVFGKTATINSGEKLFNRYFIKHRACEKLKKLV